MLRLLLSCLVLCCSLADAVCDYEGYQLKVSVGIENTYKNGLWTPITVDFWGARHIDGKLTIQCSDSDGTPITYHYEISGNKITVLAKLGRKDEPIQISLNGGKYKSFPVPPPVNAERPIYLVFGNDDIGLQGAIAELALREDRRPLLVNVNSFADLPDKWFGYEAVEMVVLTTSEPKLFDGLTADSPQIQALDDWLKLGGKMLLCLGKDAEPLVRGGDHPALSGTPPQEGNAHNSPPVEGQGWSSPPVEGWHFAQQNDGVVAGCLSPFLPGKFDGMAELRSGSALESFVNSKRQIVMNGTEEAPFMKMPRLTEPRGITFVNDGDLPLVLRCAHGLGTIIYFGGDLSERPLKNWRDRTTLVRNIMQWNRTQEREAQVPRSGAMLQLGYNDISGQIRSALDQFEGVRVVPFSVILIILTAYWLVIGLFDWFFVHKVLKRPILTWVTFPLWIVLFSVLTYALAAPGRPNEEHWNVLEVFDVDHAGEVHRHSIWMNRYSPRDWKLGGTFSNLGDGYYSWYGLPGSGLGGMAPKTVTPRIWQEGSEQISYEIITNVPIQTRATKSFFGQFAELPQLGKMSAPIGAQKHSPPVEGWHFAQQNDGVVTDTPMTTPPLRGTPPKEGNCGMKIHTQLSDEEGVPIGTIEVPDNFPHSLQNCILVYGRWALELGDIEPGQTITITKANSAEMRRDLRDLLIPPKARENENLRGLATYNPQSTDLEYIVRVMSLHRLLGGYESTGLHCAYQPSLDMSELLTADRALLLGTIKPGRTLNWVNHKSTYRCSFPIALTERSPRWRGERYELKGDELEQKVQPGLLQGGSERR